MTPLDKLLDLLAVSGLTQTEFAEVLGRDVRNVRRWLAGGNIPKAAQRQILRLENIEATAGRIVVTMRRGE